MSCDNIADNGLATREAVLVAAERQCPEAMPWLASEVAFPGTMVDRITPPSDDLLRASVRARFGLDDACAVVTEPHAEWVVEDRFCNERPPLQEVGVELVSDVTPYKQRKVRLLNGAHCALGFFGGEVGHLTTAAAMADPVMHRFVRELMTEEIVPTLGCSATGALAAYTSDVLVRLSNPRLADPLARLRARGSIRIPSYVLPTLRDAVRLGTPHRRLVLVVAAWLHQLRLSAPADSLLDDPSAEVLQRLARRCTGTVRPLLEHRAVFGDLVSDRRLVDQIEIAARDLGRYGARDGTSGGTWERAVRNGDSGDGERRATGA
jgi:fructuronate reductase/mannitol 2-dehydrogenase